MRLSHVRVNDYENVVANGQFYMALFSTVTFLVVNGKSLNLIMLRYFRSSCTKYLKMKRIMLKMEISIVHFSMENLADEIHF